MSLRDFWREHRRHREDERIRYSRDRWQDPWQEPGQESWREQSAAPPGSYEGWQDDRWQRGSEYGGSSTNPFYGERPLTRAGSTYDSSLFGAHNYPSTPWRSEPDVPAYDELVYGGRPADIESGAVAWGPFRGRGPRGYRRSDDRIKEDACQCLTDDPHIDASNIDVAVSDREVVLSGTVQSRAEKRRAEDMIERLPGVRDVINGLRVIPSESASELTGESLGAQSTTMTQGRQSGIRR